ncbi:hypothetical protein [Halobacteriovorax sp. ZH4_bin.1]|uniref:hypothetical protein n=1 Tax=unclassified Halobacteriovorax TaxID=2639665 RepID=UPI003710B661
MKNIIDILGQLEIDKNEGVAYLRFVVDDEHYGVGFTKSKSYNNKWIIEGINISPNDTAD